MFFRYARKNNKIFSGTIALNPNGLQKFMGNVGYIAPPGKGFYICGANDGSIGIYTGCFEGGFILYAKPHKNRVF